MQISLRSSKKYELLEITKEVVRLVSESNKKRRNSLAEFDGPKQRKVIVQIV